MLGLQATQTRQFFLGEHRTVVLLIGVLGIWILDIKKRMAYLSIN